MKTINNKNDVVFFTKKFVNENEIFIKKKEFGKPTCYLNGEKISRRKLGGMIFCFAVQNGMESNYTGISSDFGHQAFSILL